MPLEKKLIDIVLKILGQVPFAIPQDTRKPQHNAKLDDSKSNVVEVLTYYRQTGKNIRQKILITNKEYRTRRY